MFRIINFIKRGIKNMNKKEIKEASVLKDKNNCSTYGVFMEVN